METSARNAINYLYGTYEPEITEQIARLCRNTINYTIKHPEVFVCSTLGTASQSWITPLLDASINNPLYPFNCAEDSSIYGDCIIKGCTSLKKNLPDKFNPNLEYRSVLYPHIKDNTEEWLRNTNLFQPKINIKGYKQCPIITAFMSRLCGENTFHDEIEELQNVYLREVKKFIVAAGKNKTYKAHVLNFLNLVRYTGIMHDDPEYRPLAECKNNAELFKLYKQLPLEDKYAIFISLAKQYNPNKLFGIPLTDEQE